MAAKTYCIKAGYVHGNVNLTLEETPASYWNLLRVHTGSYFQQAVYRHAATLVAKHSLTSVLDIGCGVGHKLARYIRPLADRVVGMDQPTCIEMARRRHRDIEFQAADLDHTVEPGLGSFDLIISADVIEHLAEPDSLLRLIQMHSHAGTWVVLSTPERDLLRGQDNFQSPKKEHLREWNRQELATYLSLSGFKVVEHRVVPAYRTGLSPVMWTYYARDFLQGVPLVHCQMLVCRKSESHSTAASHDEVPEKGESDQQHGDQEP